MIKTFLLASLVAAYPLVYAVTGPVAQGDPLEICDQHASLYHWHDDLEFECSPNFIHIFSRQDMLEPMVASDTVKLGSFNLFHLGDGLAFLKRMETVAEIMNQWDVVAAQELMPLPGRWAELNREVFNLINTPGYDPNSASVRDWRVVEPGYLELLNALRKLDSSWSLMLQPSSDDFRGELAGFFYRSRKVRVKEFDYCPKSGARRNLGCSAQVPPAQRRLMSRNAFAVYFQAGSWDFIALTSHIRFRKSDDPVERQEQSDEICQNYSGDGTCKINVNNVGRFYEVKAIADQFSKLTKKDADVIFMGDFNLEITPTNIPYWQAVLKGAKGFDVYQHENTTLSVPYDNLASNYDHIILNAESTSGCRLDSIKPYDFTQARSKSDSILSDLADELNESAWSNLINQKMDVVRSLVRVGGTAGSKHLVNIGKEDQDQLQGYCDSSVGRMRKNDTGAFLELVSDHIPVSMVCATH